MSHWRRIKPALEWGFFYGVISWLLATGITNKIPTMGVWAIILSRTLMGYILIKWPLTMSWWLRGLVIGAAINVVLGVLSGISLGPQFSNIMFPWQVGFFPMLLTGMISGLLIELALKIKKEETD